MEHKDKIRFIRKDKEGVASVVGTIMALLIFMTLLTIFVTSWLPVTMKENERNHMTSVMEEFGSLKGTIDNSMIYTSIADQPSMTGYQTVDLGSEGIPAFASATSGFLTLSPKLSDNSKVSVQYSLDGTNKVNITGGGSIELYVPNRYYVQQWIAYENGAIVLKQEDGQVTRVGPGLSFYYDTVTDVLNMQFYQIDLIGENSSAAGSGNAGITTQVYVVDENSLTLDPAVPVNYTFVTEYGPAYYDFLNTTLTELGIPGSGDFDYTGATEFDKSFTYTGTDAQPDWKVSMSYSAATELYTVTLKVTNSDQSVLTYTHAYVTVEIVQ